MLRIYSLLLALLPLATVGPQSLASITEARVITEKNGNKPDTTVMRSISVAGRTRTDISGAGSLGEPWRSLGATQITMQADSTMTVTYIDSVKKSYWTMDLASVMKVAQKLIGRDVKPGTASDSATLDSLGDGGIVDGYQTIHFRAHSTSHLTMTILGDPTAWTSSQTTDYYVAPGFPRDSLKTFASRKKGNSLMDSVMTPGMKEIAAKQASAMTRMNKVGEVIKTVADSKMSAAGGMRTQRQTTELLSRRTALVPESMFMVPAGYTKTIPGFLPNP